MALKREEVKSGTYVFTEVKSSDKPDEKLWEDRFRDAGREVAKRWKESRGQFVRIGPRDKR